MSAAKFSLHPVQVSFETAHPVTARPVMFGDELQAEPLPGIPGLEVIVYYSGDGALVVQIDTKEIDMISRRGRLRVNLNEDTIYDGAPDTDTWPDFDRHIKIACDDLYDEPDSLEARATLLALLTRSCGGTARAIAALPCRATGLRRTRFRGYCTYRPSPPHPPPSCVPQCPNIITQSYNQTCYFTTQYVPVPDRPPNDVPGQIATSKRNTLPYIRFNKLAIRAAGAWLRCSAAGLGRCRFPRACWFLGCRSLASLTRRQ
jgi:hypothetical protein